MAVFPYAAEPPRPPMNPIADELLKYRTARLEGGPFEGENLDIRDCQFWSMRSFCRPTAEGRIEVFDYKSSRFDGDVLVMTFLGSRVV
jgi:hypothetical protein